MLLTIIHLIAATTAFFTNRQKHTNVFYFASFITIIMIPITGYQTLEKDKKIESLNSRETIIALADRVLYDADAYAFDELKKLEKETSDSPLNLVVNAQIVRIETQWPLASRKRNEKKEAKEFAIDCEGGIRIRDCLRSELLNHLLNNEDWFKRSMVANSLARHKNKEVIEALIHAIKNDPILDVRSRAVKSLNQLLRPAWPVSLRELLFFESSFNYWEEIREEYLKNLK